MALVSELVTKVTAETNNFAAGMAKVAALAATTAVAVVAAVNSMTDRIDKLGKTAQKLGVNFEAFQGLKYAADIANVPVEKLQAGMARLARNVYDAANGNEEAASSFSRLGLSAASLQNMSLDKQYLAISSAISKLPNKNEQLALSMKIFGKAGVDNLLLIRENISGLAGEYEALGLTITEQQRAASEEFQDTKTKMEAVFSGFSGLVSANVAPAFTILMDELTKSLVGMGDLKAAARELASVLVSVTQFAVQGFNVFLNVLDAVQSKIDFIITDIHNAIQRAKSSFSLVTGVNTNPSPRVPTARPDTYSLGAAGTGDAFNALKRLDELQNSLSGPAILTSFIAPLDMAGTALNKFTTATEKATSTIGSTIQSNIDSKTNDRIAQLLAKNPGFDNTKPVYTDPQFEMKYQNVFDAITKSQLSEEQFKLAIADLAERAKADGRGTFNAMPNIAAVQDLQKYGAEKGFVGTQKQHAELKVFIKADKGFLTEFTDQPQFGDAVGKWLEIITESAT